MYCQHDFFQLLLTVISLLENTSVLLSSTAKLFSSLLSRLCSWKKLPCAAHITICLLDGEESTEYYLEFLLEWDLSPCHNLFMFIFWVIAQYYLFCCLNPSALATECFLKSIPKLKYHYLRIPHSLLCDTMRFLKVPLNISWFNSLKSPGSIFSRFRVEEEVGEREGIREKNITQ